jgi:hypothetical protein
MMTINKLNRTFLNTKTALIIFLTVFAFAVNAQEIIKEKPTDSVKVKLPQSRQKADGIIATVGEYMVLDSDIDKSYLEISSQGNSGSYAAKLCADYSVIVGGVTYDDWYLPSRDELNKLYINRVAIGGFSNYYYWSSTELSSTYAFSQYFSDGFFYASNKMYPNDVRAIRAF